jgi:hypothetical protein
MAALRRHRHHYRPPQPHRVPGCAADPMQPSASAIVTGRTNTSGTSHRHLRELTGSSLTAIPLKINYSNKVLRGGTGYYGRVRGGCSLG